MALKKLRKTLGIRAKFIIMMAGLGVLALGFMGYGAYDFSMQNAMKEADTKAKIVEAYVKAGRSYFMTEQRPLLNALLEEDRFFPVLQSSFGITRQILDRIQEKSLQGFQFKQASLVPHHQPNKADLFEQKIIEKFAVEKVRELTGTIEKNGEPFYYRARPIRMAGKNCLRCHKDPADAPKDLIEAYGTDGFDKNFKTGDIFAAYMIYVPLGPAMEAAKRQAVVLFAVGGSIMIIGLLVIYFFLDIRIVKPLLELSSRTQEVSVGRNLEKTLMSGKMKDEVETLARSVDRLRISLLKMLKRRNSN